jgi:Carboxypeptidase regulatory-like domain
VRYLLAVGAVGLLAACGSGTIGATGSAGSGSGPSGSARIVGTVTAGPTCPVERAGSPCPDRPVAGALVRVMRLSSVVATARTDATGAFRLEVAPGAYTVVATNAGGYQSTAKRAVSLVAGQRATVDFVLDTGIR